MRLDSLAKHLLPLLLLAGCGSATAEGGSGGARTFYVDPAAGSDQAAGTVEAPYRTFDRALQTVSERVDSGIRSDTIYLRGGVYRKESIETLWRLNLHGTPEAYSVISAMPADSGAPNAVRRKSGRWYERVVFDDGQRITSHWTRVDGHPGVWQTDPGYTELEWTHQNVWPWVRWESDPLTTTPDDDTPTTTSFTVGPYMVLQDGEPFLWADDLDGITGPGVRSYDHDTGILYLWPHDGVDPNSVVIESWYGGREPYREGVLYLDGDGRALFDGDMQYAELRGVEFRMFVRLFEFARHGYPRVEDRGIQRHVRIMDNEFRYGWTHFLIDSNTVHGEDPPGPPYIPRYEDRSDWLVRNNVFFRPSREVFQVHGDNHVFEHNLVIDHIGPWAGPAGVVGALNARNMRHFTMRYNVFEGHANVAQNRGSIFMVEVGDDSHADAEGNYIFGDLTVENNLFLNVSGGASLVLGKGGVRMRNITVRGNVFDNQVGGRTIQISSPHQNLVIENNVFRGQSAPIGVFAPSDTNPMTTPMLPSTISIRRNIFVGGEGTIDPALFEAAEGSEIEVSHNVFFANEGPAVGDDAVVADPLFRDPSRLDYRLRPGSPAILPGADAGVYDAESEPDPAARWWQIMADAPRAIEAGSKGLNPAGQR